MLYRLELARYPALHRIFWPARKDGEDFELEELICDQRASEFEKSICILLSNCGDSRTFTMTS